MREIDITKKIEGALNGFTGPDTPRPTNPRPRGFGAPSPRVPPRSAPAPQVHRTSVQATRASIPFYENMRRFQPDAAQIFEQEQKAAREYREEFAPEQTGYDFPTYSPISEDTGMTVVAKVAKGKHHAARILFMDWLKTDQPEIYADLVRKLETGEVGATQAQTTATATQPLWQRIVSGLSTLTATVAGAQAQKRILDLNIQRAAQGLPPVDAASMAPVVRTEVAITPEMAADLRAGASKALIYGGIAAAGLLLFSLMRKRR